jgi:kynurenine formamidase
MIVDLTCPLSPDTPVYPGDPPVTLTTVRTHGADGYEVTHLCVGSHSGTHLDAPRHFFPGGATLDEYPVDRLVGPGVVVDVRSQTAGPALIEAALLSERLRLAGAVPGDFILLWTGGAFLSPQAAGVLLDTGTTLVGTDGSSLDPPPPAPSGGPSERAGVGETVEAYAAHRLLLGNGVLLAERLCNLDRLGPGPVNCAFLPLAFVGTDGAPVRAIAWR